MQFAYRGRQERYIQVLPTGLCTNKADCVVALYDAKLLISITYTAEFDAAIGLSTLLVALAVFRRNTGVSYSHPYNDPLGR